MALPAVKMAEVVARMLGAKYNLYGHSPEEGFNCLSYIYWFYREMGVDVPDRMGRHNKDNYIRYWEKSPKRAKLALVRYLKRLGESIDPAFYRAGDLVLLKGEEMLNAIYLGNGNFLTCDMRVGVIVVPRRGIDCDVVEVIRPCPK